MDTKKRTQRSSAGLNESLSQDFVWPKKFGKEKVPLQEQAAKSVDDNCFIKPMNGKSLNENKYSENRLVTIVTHDRQEEKKEMSPSSEKACSSNISKKTRTSLTSRRLAIEAEKKRQQLEMEIDQIKSEMKRKENEIKLINMEEDLRRDEMKSLTEKSTISGIIHSRNEIEEKYEKSVRKSTAQWVDNLPEKFDEIENLSVLSQRYGKPREDIKLWRNLETSKNPEVFELNVMTFGAKCSPACAQFVKNYNAQRYAEQEIQDTIIQKFYVGDFVESKDTETGAIGITEKVKGTMSLAGFEVVKWLSNSKLVQNISNDADENKNISEEVTIQRVLGIWNTQTDELSFKVEMEKFHGIKPTKRNILKSVMSIFDPLGIISYIVVKGKILMQHIWQAGVSWDEEIAHIFGERWEKLLVQISKVSEVRIPRCYSLLIPWHRQQDKRCRSEDGHPRISSTST